MKKQQYSKTYKASARLIEHWLTILRRPLATVDATPQLVLLGMLAGALTSLVILSFRWIIEVPLALGLMGSSSEDFESLPRWMHFLLPICGAIVIGGILQLIDRRHHKVGLIHTINRYNHHQGNFLLSNTLVQFFGGIAAIISGQSIGREGPAIHLGAAASSQLGQWLKLPNNSVRILVGCGVAAAIAVSFNTPIAGVIFAMEVVMIEYTVAGMTPIIIASAIGGISAQAFYGSTPAFSVPNIQMNSLLEIPFMILAGISIGTAAALFVRLQKAALGFQHYPISLRLITAGILTGCAAFYVPEIMGIGYDTVQKALLGELGLGILLAAMATKLIVSSICIGLGIPGGVIGPTFFIGACIGGTMGIIGNSIYPEYAATPSFYVMLGMGAMMGACLNAPLAALMAVLELTSNSNIILPSMIVIVTANMVRGEFFKQKTVWQTLETGIDSTAEQNPFLQLLQRTAVSSIMERSLRVCSHKITYRAANAFVAKSPKWIVMQHPDKHVTIVETVKLERLLQNLTPSLDSIDIIDIPTTMLIDTVTISIRATLAEAIALLDSANVDALCVIRETSPMRSPIIGIIRRADIADYYQFSPKNLPSINQQEVNNKSNKL